MGPQSDVEKIQEIYRAEREADRIVREAEEAARLLVAGAEAEAKACLAERRRACALRAAEALAGERAGTEAEARAFLESARLRTEEWLRLSEARIDAIASALIDKVLPP